MASNTSGNNKQQEGTQQKQQKSQEQQSNQQSSQKQSGIKAKLASVSSPKFALTVTCRVLQIVLALVALILIGVAHDKEAQGPLNRNIVDIEADDDDNTAAYGFAIALITVLYSIAAAVLGFMGKEPTLMCIGDLLAALLTISAGSCLVAVYEDLADNSRWEDQAELAEGSGALLIAFSIVSSIFVVRAMEGSGAILPK